MRTVKGWIDRYGELWPLVVFVIAGLLTLLLRASDAGASTTTWYWSEARAEHALVALEKDVYDADCSAYGQGYHGLHRRFACDTWDINDDYFGSGRLYVLGPGLGRYRFTWDYQ